MNFNASPVVGNGTRSFLKLQDRDSLTGVFRGPVHEFFVQWKDNKTVPCEETNPGASFRFRINFVIKENDVLVAKIWEGGATVYNQLKELHGEFSLPNTVVKITRNGSGKNTTYSIMPAKKHEVTKTMEDQLQAVELNPLESKQSRDQITPSEFDPDEEIPF